MFHTLLMDINDNNKKYYKEFLSNIIKISKEYQKDNK